MIVLGLALIGSVTGFILLGDLTVAKGLAALIFMGIGIALERTL